MRSITDYVFSRGPIPDSGFSQPISASDVTDEMIAKGQAVGVPKSWFTDPFALLDSLGLGYKASPSSLSYETLKQMSENNVVVASIIQTRTHQMASFSIPQPNKYSIGFRIAPRDPNRKISKEDVREMRELETFVQNCGDGEDNDREDFETYIKKIVRDRLIYDQMTTEIISTYGGKPCEFFAVPGNTIRLASPKNRKGAPLTPKEKESTPKYVQVIDGAIVNTYTPNEMAFSVANPRTDIRAWGYGYSELEMLIRTITAHLWAEEWNRRAFSQGSTAKGILNIKGNIPPQQMESFKRQWLTQVSGVANAWRTPVINSNDDIQWISLQPTNNEMGYMQWMEYLIKVACAIYLIDPSEINFDIRGGIAQKPVFMSTNEAQQKLSQDRGLRPLLRHVQTHVNRNVIRKRNPRYMFEYVGVDAKTEAEAIDLRLKELQSYKTLNEIRETEQLPPVPYGDVVPNPSYIGYRNQKELAQQQQQMGGMGAPPGAQQAEPGGAMDKFQSSVKKEVGDEAHPKKPDLTRVPDRHRPPEEEWETTYTASLSPATLRKAVSPFEDLIR